MVAVACDNTFKVPISVQYSRPHQSSISTYIARLIEKYLIITLTAVIDEKRERLKFGLRHSDYRDNLFKFLLPHYARDSPSNGIFIALDDSNVFF